MSRTRNVKLGLFAVIVVGILFQIGIVTVAGMQMDYPVFHWAGVCVRHNQLDLLYDAEARSSFYMARLGESHPRMAFLYHPPIAYLLTPLTGFDMELARRIWLGIQLVILVGGLYFLTRYVYRGSNLAAGTVLAIGLWLGPVSTQQAFGQFNVMLLALVIAAMALDNLHVLVGLFWGIALMIKPHMGILLTAWWDRPAVLVSAAATVLLLNLAVGWRYLLSFVQAIPSIIMTNLNEMRHSVSTLTVLRALIGPAGNYVYIALLVAGMVFIVRSSRTLAYKERVAYSIAALGALTPVLEYHHLTLLLIPIALLIVRWEHLPTVAWWVLVVSTAGLLPPYPLIWYPNLEMLPLLASWGVWGAFTIDARNRGES